MFVGQDDEDSFLGRFRIRKNLLHHSWIMRHCTSPYCMSKTHRLSCYLFIGLRLFVVSLCQVVVILSLFIVVLCLFVDILCILYLFCFSCFVSLCYCCVSLKYCYASLQSLCVSLWPFWLWLVSLSVKCYRWRPSLCSYAHSLIHPCSITRYIICICVFSCKLYTVTVCCFEHGVSINN